MDKLNVLLIDDDDLFLMLTEKLLKNAPCLGTFSSSNKVKDALEYLDACQAGNNSFPDVIFVDMNMPEMSGIDFARLYEQNYALLQPEVKLVILTSSISRKEKVQAMEINVVQEFMQKPLTKKKLQGFMEQYLSQR